MSHSRASLTERGKADLGKLLNEAVSAARTPAVFLGATDAGQTMLLECAGDIVCGAPESGKVGLDTTVQLYSATKLVTTVACLQLVDAGLVSLDNADDVSKHLPELAEFKVLKGYTSDGQEIIEEQEPKGAITLRMLLSHTSGLTYAWNGDMARWMTSRNKRLLGFLSPDASIDDYTYPLTFQPGTSWGYGIGLDWAAFLVERITGQSIEQRYRKTIFDPCGMSSTTFYPSKVVKDRLMRMTFYDPDQKPVAYGSSFTDSLLPRPEDPDTMGPVLSGGGGLFSTASDYLAFLRGVLASSTGLRSSQSKSTVSPLLSDASFRELFKDVLAPEGKKALVEMMKTQTYHDPALLVDGSGKDVGHSVGLCLNLKDSKFGRKAGSGCWDGAAKTQYWIDPETGIAGLCFTNTFATNPCPFMQFYNEYETTLYAALETAK